MAATATACFECNGTGLCDCIICTIETPTGYGPGPCIPCKGRRRWAQLRPILERKGIDPRESQFWRLVRSTTGGCHRVFIPMAEMETVLKERERATKEWIDAETESTPRIQDLAPQA